MRGVQSRHPVDALNISEGEISWGMGSGVSDFR